MNRSTDKKNIKMYHRIYRMHKKDISPMQIAATLKIPKKSVLRILNKMNDKEGLEKKPAEKREPWLTSVLDKQHKYMVVKLAGELTQDTVNELTEILQEFHGTRFKKIAFDMSEIQKVDNKGMNSFMVFVDQFTKGNNYCAILNPSEAAEEYIEENALEKRINVFGTVSSFEKYAFMDEFNK